MSFKDIKGQDKALWMLQRAIQTDRVAHGYLFVGADGVGKRLLARNFAKALNCEAPLEEVKQGRGRWLDCCDQCPPCRKIDGFNHIDVGWLEPGGFPYPNPLPGGKGEKAASSSIRIEQIRQLQDQLILKPYEARYKVYIIPKAESMTEEASNALLKSLEEPPAYSILILTSSDKDRLLPTIASRCQIVRFSNLKKELVVQILTQDLGLGPLAASFLAAVSQAGLGEALKFVESLPAKEPRPKASFEEQGHTDAAEELSQPSRINRKRAFFRRGEDILERKNRVIDSFRQEALKEPQQELWFYKESRQAIEAALQILTWWYRDILVLKHADENRLLAACATSADGEVLASSFAKVSQDISVGTPSEARPNHIHRGFEGWLANLDRKDELLSESHKHSSHQIVRAIDIITQTASLIHNNANPRLALGVMTMELANLSLYP